MFCQKIIFPIFLLSFISACSSTSTVKIQSTPEDAVVSVMDNNGVATVIGKTPLTSAESEVYRSSNRYSQIQIKKDNYKPQEIVLVKSTMGSETIVNVQLTKEEANLNGIEQSQAQEKIASAVARANGLIQSKQYAEAEAIMANFVEQYPNISVGYDYLGNLNYLQKRFPKALRFYKKALSLNPQNAERRNIVDKLESLVKSENSGEAL